VIFFFSSAALSANAVPVAVNTNRPAAIIVENRFIASSVVAIFMIVKPELGRSAWSERLVP
jgi:hypothetical protein